MMLNEKTVQAWLPEGAEVASISVSSEIKPADFAAALDEIREQLDPEARVLSFYSNALLITYTSPGGLRVNYGECRLPAVDPREPEEKLRAVVANG